MRKPIWCCKCHKRGFISINGRDYCGQCANKGFVSGKRKTLANYTPERNPFWSETPATSEPQ